MDNIFTLKDEEEHMDKLNLDDLYEKKHLDDLGKLKTYNKILNRIHIRIKTVSRQKKDSNFCWFVVPEIILGCVKYDNNACITFLIDKLMENGFNVKYIHPNLLFISWQHWIPNYVRDEIKKKTGVVVDGYGKVISDKNKNNDNLNSLITNKTKNNSNQKNINDFKSTTSSVYSKDLLTRIKNTKNK